MKELCRNVRIFGKTFCNLKNILLVLFSFIFLQVSAENLADTAKKERQSKPDSIKATSFIFPAALVAYGALSFEVHPIRRFDFYIRGQIQNSAPDFHTNAETFFLFTPIVMVYGLNLAGVEGKNNFVDRTVIIALAGVMGGVTDYSLKHLTHRQSPGGSPVSFPSGHSIAAFAGAEFLAQEYGDQSPIYTVIGYTVAATTGVFRLYNRDHWFSDLAAGAGFGIASTKIAYLIYPSIKKWLTHTDKSGKSTFIVPTYQDGVAGFAFAKTF